MITFLVSGDFAQTARILDPIRLSRQISEVCQVAKLLKFWDAARPVIGVSYNPVINLWLDNSGKPLFNLLYQYHEAMNNEWAKIHDGQGHKSFSQFGWGNLLDSLGFQASKTFSLSLPPYPSNGNINEWSSDVYLSHRSRLLSKEYGYYHRAFKREGLEIPNLGLKYVWEGPCV